MNFDLSLGSSVVCLLSSFGLPNSSKPSQRLTPLVRLHMAADNKWVELLYVVTSGHMRISRHWDSDCLARYRRVLHEHCFIIKSGTICTILQFQFFFQFSSQYFYVTGLGFIFSVNPQ
jgi:hypothetical protein